ncbi:MAG: acyl-CoA synthetase [Pseudomonadota bacterium]
MNWNFGDMLDAVAANVPADRQALVHPGRTRTWREFASRSNALARAFLARGACTNSKIAMMMRNRPDYMEALAASFKARMVHVNVNFRYTGDELFYIFDNSDTEVIVYGEEFSEVIAALRPRLTKVKLFAEIFSETKRNDFAQSYEDLCNGDDTPLGNERSSKDLLFVYTGGTTGLPKGVMWPHENLWDGLGGGAQQPGMPRPQSMEDYLSNVAALNGTGRLLVLAPFMHGAGMMTSINTLCMGGTIITLAGDRFDPVETLQSIQENKATQMLMVGDAFAKPILNALDGNPGRFDLSSMMVIISSGAMWSSRTKEGLLKHNPNMILLDTYGSSEGIGLGTSITTAKGTQTTAKFKLGPKTKLFTEDLKEIPAGSAERGLVGRAGTIPIGYYKDEAKTAKTFPVIDGVRYSMPGDWATADAEGMLTLLGRGNQCINSGGEKIFPEEVEEALKTHASIEDTLVIGTADEKWGQAVTALVHVSQPVPDADLSQHVKKTLAAYKAPKNYLQVDAIPRQPNGKADYVTAKKIAEAMMSA